MAAMLRLDQPRRAAKAPACSLPRTMRHASAASSIVSNPASFSCSSRISTRRLRRGDQDENPASYVDGLVGKTFFVLNKLVGSGHMSGLPVRCI